MACVPPGTQSLCREMRPALSESKHHPTGVPGVLDGAVHLSGGFTEADRPRVHESLSVLGPHLFRWERRGMALEVSGEDRHVRRQTVEDARRAAGYPTLVAKGANLHLGSALTAAKARARQAARGREEETGAPEEPAPPEEDLLPPRRSRGAPPTPGRPSPPSPPAADARTRRPPPPELRRQGLQVPELQRGVDGHRLPPLHVDVVGGPPAPARSGPSTAGCGWRPWPRSLGPTPWRYMKAVSPGSMLLTCRPTPHVISTVSPRRYGATTRASHSSGVNTRSLRGPGFHVSRTKCMIYRTLGRSGCAVSTSASAR